MDFQEQPPSIQEPMPAFARGWYARIDLDMASVSDHFACPAQLVRYGSCAPAEVIRFRNSLTAGPDLGFAVGYRLARYIALQANATVLSGGDANRVTATVADRSTQVNDGWYGRASVRLDYPLSLRLSIYGTYGYGRAHVTLRTSEPSNHQSPDTDVVSYSYDHLAIDGTHSVAVSYIGGSVGLEWLYEGRFGVELEYLPPTRGMSELSLGVVKCF